MKKSAVTSGLVLALVFFALLLANIVLGKSFPIDKINKISPVPLPPISKKTQRFHETLVIADLHNDLLLAERDSLVWNQAGHSDIPRLLAGKVRIQILSAVTKAPFGLNPVSNSDKTDMLLPLTLWQRWPLATWFDLTERALYQAEKLRKMSEHSSVTLITSASQLDDYSAPGYSVSKNGLGVLLAIEGLHALEGDEANFQRLYDAGYRMMGLAHFFDNKLSGSAHGLHKGPLTPFGQRIVERMVESGVIIDLAHTSPTAIDEVLAMVSVPVVVSHTGVKGTCKGMRNLSDQQIKAVAAGGGVIGIGFWTTAVCDITPDGIVKAIRYVSDLVGVEHVALGTDYDGAITVGFSADNLVSVTHALLKANFSEVEIRLIMGENILRVLGQVLR